MTENLTELAERRGALSQVQQVYACLKPYEQRELVRLVLHRAEVHVRELVMEINGAFGQAISPATVDNGGVVRRTQDWLPGEGLRPQHLKRKKGAHMGAWADLLARGGHRTGLP